MKILIVDNSDNTILKLSRYLKCMVPHAEIITAPTGDIALEIFKSAPNIKILITEYNIPHGGAVELVSIIKDNDPTIVSLCVTTESDDKNNKVFDAFLTKPIEREKFNSSLVYAIQLSRKNNI